MVLVSIFFSFHWDSLLLSLDTTAGFQWSPFPCLAVVSEALKERETKEWKGMLKCSWLAVELREWFASTRSTSRIHKMSRIIRLRVQPYERRALLQETKHFSRIQHSSFSQRVDPDEQNYKRKDHCGSTLRKKYTTIGHTVHGCPPSQKTRRKQKKVLAGRLMNRSIVSVSTLQEFIREIKT